MTNGWGKLAIGLRMGNHPDPQFLVSWTRLVMRGMRDGDVVLDPAIGMPHHQAAERLYERLLTTDCDSLLFIDDDMTFTERDIEALRHDVDGEAYGILQGLCLSSSSPHRPLIFLEKDNGVYELPADAPQNVIVDVGLVGLAFTLVKREVLADVRKATPEKEMMFCFHPRGHGEDANFCMRARKLGVRIGVSTRVQIGHRVTVVVKWDPEKNNVVYEE